jgi:hypothetical protein
MSSWSEWRSFPSSTKGNTLVAPIGPGVYELRHKSTHRLIRVGESTTVAKRMKSLLPPPYGTGTRNNLEVRNYILANVADVEYRALACQTKEEAKRVQDDMLASSEYLFHT